MQYLKLLFGMEERVPRKHYVFWGISLMVLKYAGELALYYVAKGEILRPLSFFSPFLQYRYPGTESLPDWFAPAVVLWTLPFVWIGVGMSIRRAADAAISPWVGILFFIPGVNYLLFAILSFVPSSPSATWGEERAKKESHLLFSPVVISIAVALVGTLLVALSTNLVRSYLASLFIGTPFFLGLIQGYFLNQKGIQSFRKNAAHVFSSVLAIHLLLLLFALEGAICLLMSLPLSTALAIVGALFGASIAKYGKPGRVSPALFVLTLPLFSFMETKTTASIPHRDVVLSEIEVDRAPEQVWPNVVKFSDLPPNEEWLFRLGVARPLRARIEGTGVGAIRHCEFSTGAFVEPITVWNEPHQLGFDVKYQPAPMQELSLYDKVHAPHLDGYFRSVKGEFRLVPLPNGRTRLEGRTWYEMDLHPGWYWQIYGRWIIHRIHLRVLDHVKNLSEASEGAKT